MAKFTVEWRQAEDAATGPSFGHRVAYASDARGVRRIAEDLGDRAWGREFRLLHGGREVFTNLHAIQDWTSTDADLPAPARTHRWRHDLERNLAVDLLLDAIRRASVPAVAGGVMSSADADALLRFAVASLRRPDL